MDDFTSKMVSGLLLIASGISQWDEMTDARLTDFEAQLNVVGDAITYEKELREAALEAAGGADIKGDTNRARKISMPIFSRVPDLKYGEGYCEKHDVIYYLQNGKHCPNCELEKIDISGVKPGWKSKSMSKGNI